MESVLRVFVPRVRFPRYVESCLSPVDVVGQAKDVRADVN